MKFLDQSGLLYFLKKTRVYVDKTTMPLTGGTLGSYTEEAVDTSGEIKLSHGNVFIDTPDDNRVYSINDAKAGVAHSFTLIINMGDTVHELSFPDGIRWQGGEGPDASNPNKTYLLTFMTVDAGESWLGIFGGEF